MQQRFRPGFLRRKPKDVRDFALERLELSEGATAFEMDWLRDWAERADQTEKMEQLSNEQ